MIIARLPHDPTALADFFEEALGGLGALCEREWHDRLNVIAEGAASRLWRDDGDLHEARLHFIPADALLTGTPADAASEVFPGCPLTFRLAESLRTAPLTIERAAIAADHHARLPDATVIERLWHTQHPDSRRWRMLTPLKPACHFSLVALVRCEMQAIDQHWSLHRIALSLPDGATDESLASELDVALLTQESGIPWPAADTFAWTPLLTRAIEHALAPELAPVRARQERHLRREFDRINDYFAAYEAELTSRTTRSRTPDAQTKLEARLAATRIEREHRRRDQCARHEIRIIPHIDSLLLVGETAQACRVSWQSQHVSHESDAIFIPRARRWLVV